MIRHDRKCHSTVTKEHIKTIDIDLNIRTSNYPIDERADHVFAIGVGSQSRVSGEVWHMVCVCMVLDANTYV